MNRPRRAVADGKRFEVDITAFNELQHGRPNSRLDGPEDALFRDQNGVAHVTRGGLCVAVESRDFEDELFERYREETGRIPGPDKINRRKLQ